MGRGDDGINILDSLWVSLVLSDHYGGHHERAQTADHPARGYQILR